jgi:hypothetical protein
MNLKSFGLVRRFALAAWLEVGICHWFVGTVPCSIPPSILIIILSPTLRPCCDMGRTLCIDYGTEKRKERLGIYTGALPIAPGYNEFVSGL